MPRKCTICDHPSRAAIDKDLIAGRPYRHIADQYGVSTTSLQRHQNGGHIAQKAVKAAEKREIRTAADLIDQMQKVNQETWEILDGARTAGDHELALKAIARVEKQIELQGRLLGELKDAPTVNVLMAPEWVQLRTVILQVLEPYPEARLQLAERLQEVEHVHR